MMLLRDLTKFANDLDSSGLKKEADTVDDIINAVKRLLEERASSSDKERGDVESKQDQEGGPEKQVELFGFKTINFDICPGAVAAFDRIKEQLGDSPDEKEERYALEAIKKTDDLFQIEKNAISSKSLTTRESESAGKLFREILYNVGALSSEADKEFLSDFEFLDGHIDKIKSFSNKKESSND